MINTIAVRNEAQRILYKEMQGQFSDGYWENSTMPWKDWSNAEVIVDPENVGVQGHASRYYNLTNRQLIEWMADDFIARVIHGHSCRTPGTGDETYDRARLMKDLRDLKKIQKTQRAVVAA